MSSSSGEMEGLLVHFLTRRTERAIVFRKEHETHQKNAVAAQEGATGTIVMILVASRESLCDEREEVSGLMFETRGQKFGSSNQVGRRSDIDMWYSS